MKRLASGPSTHALSTVFVAFIGVICGAVWTAASFGQTEKKAWTQAKVDAMLTTRVVDLYQQSVKQLQTENALPFVVEFMRSPENRVGDRIGAAKVLGAIGTADARAALVDMLDRLKQEPRATQVGGGLGGLGNLDVWVEDALYKCAGKESEDQLLKDLEDDNASIRRSAAYELGNRKSVAAVELLRLRLDDSERLVRYYAAQALGQIGDERAVDKLIAIVKSRRQGEGDGYAATTALGAIGTPRCIEALKSIKPDDPWYREAWETPPLLAARFNSKAETFLLTLRWYEGQDKTPTRQTLAVTASKDAPQGFDRVARITPQQANGIIDALLRDRFLAEATDLSFHRGDPGQGHSQIYHLAISTKDGPKRGKHLYGPNPYRRSLELLRTMIDGDAAAALDNAMEFLKERKE